MLITGRRDPADAFVRTTRSSPWDEFHVSYFAGGASWNYFVVPSYSPAAFPGGA
jgi:hypothetical protein